MRYKEQKDKLLDEIEKLELAQTVMTQHSYSTQEISQLISKLSIEYVRFVRIDTKFPIVG